MYLPFQSTPGDLSNYLETLGELEGFIDSQSFDRLLIVGDFNVDFEKHLCSARLLCRFMDDFNVTEADLPFKDSVGFTYERDDGLVRSWVDHIVCSNSFVACVDNVHRVSLGCNLSDHHPLSFNILLSTSPSQHPLNVSVCDWAKATSDVDNYCRCVSSMLPVISPDISQCCDPSCSIHLESIDLCCDQ